MRTVLFDFKTAKEEWFDIASATYVRKISAFVDFQIISLKSPKSDREDSVAKKKSESEELLKKITADDYVFLFDEKGKTYDSIAFSKQIELAQMSGKKRMVFIIGGAFGVSEEIKNRSQVKVSLSSMVMNHLVAETVALEQIYRAHTILKRIPYHNI
ncbi:MAG: 23S rRNA (pseudouridine(1915)-N(3))-methyltransferase RlmH [Pseudobdellovibrio sp.]